LLQLCTAVEDFDSHISDIEEVLKQIEKANFKIKPSKCSFAANKTKFLGFIISEKGIEPNPAKIEAIKNYPVPKTTKQIKRFLGMASYYRRFIPNFSSITEPINRLLKKNARFNWSDQCHFGFNKIIYHLTNPPLLAFPDFNKEFILSTDALNSGLGAVLSQNQKEGEITIHWCTWKM
jgi:hypothetical protein